MNRSNQHLGQSISMAVVGVLASAGVILLISSF